MQGPGPPRRWTTGTMGKKSMHHTPYGPPWGWPLPKRWLFVLLLGIFGILTILSGLSRDQTPRPTTRQDSTPLSETSPSTSPYLLGPDEDGTKLWFPPPWTETPFQPSAASDNLPPAISERPRTPLFIAFTRNIAMLQQTVLSYIAAGWPREDIIVVDNRHDGCELVGTPHLAKSVLPRLRTCAPGGMVSRSCRPPTLLSFAQLMNFYLRISMAHGWRYLLLVSYGCRHRD
ncbi:hypothetical protein CLCR_02565 [Cladophialophora carrionii]|uniref:Uncharacterized protein n=1 Tax=Cladophialophora carrionii TaxID=86049 RepID=A0A1C1CEI9_9EURO|nr:hypothetical protein CLCR_02565 [Cladophialophora carrionii]